MRRIARVTPTIIIGIFGSCGQSVERETVMSVDIQSITFRQLKTAKKHSVLICWKLSMPFPSSPYYFTLISLLKGWKVLPWNVTKILANYFHCYFGTFSCCVQIQSQMLRRKVRTSFSNDDHLKIIFKFSKKSYSNFPMILRKRRKLHFSHENKEENTLDLLRSKKYWTSPKSVEPHSSWAEVLNYCAQEHVVLQHLKCLVQLWQSCRNSVSK